MGHGCCWGGGSCLGWHQRHIVRVVSVLCLLTVQPTGWSQLRRSPWSRVSLGPAWAILVVSFFVFSFLLEKK